jgi:hypothetical protein
VGFGGLTVLEGGGFFFFFSGLFVFVTAVVLGVLILSIDSFNNQIHFLIENIVTQA